MNEKQPNFGERGRERSEIIEKRIALAKELSEQKEKFPFVGITEEAYIKIKVGEDEFPGFATPIAQILERCQNEGIKVVVVSGPNAESGNVYIVPSESDDIENDSIFPRHLKVDDTTDERLKKLVELDSISTRK